MLSDYYESVNGNLGTLITCLNCITITTLQVKLNTLSNEKIEEKTKDELHCKLYDLVIPDEDKPNTAEDDNVASSTKEKMCWNKGNWLTYMAEISRQINYLGPRPLIW